MAHIKRKMEKNEGKIKTKNKIFSDIQKLKVYLSLALY